jgi:hypothetical protein
MRLFAIISVCLLILASTANAASYNFQYFADRSCGSLIGTITYNGCFSVCSQSFNCTLNNDCIAKSKTSTEFNACTNCPASTNMREQIVPTQYGVKFQLYYRSECSSSDQPYEFAMKVDQCLTQIGTCYGSFKISSVAGQ